MYIIQHSNFRSRVSQERELDKMSKFPKTVFGFVHKIRKDEGRRYEILLRYTDLPAKNRTNFARGTVENPNFCVSYFTDDPITIQAIQAKIAQ